MVLGALRAACSRARVSSRLSLQPMAPTASWTWLRDFAPGMGMVPLHMHQLIATCIKPKYARAGWSNTAYLQCVLCGHNWYFILALSFKHLNQNAEQVCLGVLTWSSVDISDRQILARIQCLSQSGCTIWAPLLLCWYTYTDVKHRTNIEMEEDQI